MKSQAKSPPSARAWPPGPAGGLADERDARRGEGAHLLNRHVLRRSEDLDLLPDDLADALQVRRDPGAVKPVDQTRHRSTRPGARTLLLEPDETRLAAGAAGVAAVGEEPLHSQLVHSPAASIRSTPAARRSRQATSVRSSMLPAATPSPTPAKDLSTSVPTS